MPFQAVPDVAQCQLMGVVDSQLTINDLYFEISGGGITPVNLGLLANAVALWFSGSLAPLLSEDWSATRVVATDLGSPTGARRENPAITPGGITGEAAPNNVAAVVSLRTDQRGRSGRGRNFVPAIPNSVITLNTLDDTYISDLTSAYFALVGPGTFIPGWQLVIVSRVSAGVVRPTGIAIPVTDTLMTSNSVRSMRSREIGHGA